MGDTTNRDRPLLVHVTTVPDSLTFLRGQAAFMRDRGLEVEVISSPGPDLDRFARILGVVAHAVPMTRRVTPLRDVVALIRIARLLRRMRPTIVHSHTPKGGLLGVLAAAITGVPVRVYHMRGLPHLAARGLKRQLLRATERVACRSANRVVCVSHSIRHIAVEEGLTRPERIVVAASGSGQGVDAAGRFDPTALPLDTRRRVRADLGVPTNAVVIGFVGRIVRDKGIVELTAAWRRLRERDPSLHLLVIGPWEPTDPVPEELAATLREDPRVHLPGQDWEVAKYYAAMDMVVLPSHREGFPNVLLEAAAMRLPAVATRVPGCVDAVVDGVTGMLVPPGDAPALAKAIQGYAADPDLRADHGEAGRARVLREFRPEAIWEHLYDEYLALMRARQLPPPASGME